MGFPISFEEWCESFEASDRIVKQDVVKGRQGTVWISTVHIGINYRFLGDGPPLIFETMAFEIKPTAWNAVVGRTDMAGIDQFRTTTEDQARKAHAWFYDLYG